MNHFDLGLFGLLDESWLGLLSGNWFELLDFLGLRHDFLGFAHDDHHVLVHVFFHFFAFFADIVVLALETHVSYTSNGLFALDAGDADVLDHLSMLFLQLCKNPRFIKLFAFFVELLTGDN